MNAVIFQILLLVAVIVVITSANAKDSNIFKLKRDELYDLDDVKLVAKRGICSNNLLLWFLGPILGTFCQNLGNGNNVNPCQINPCKYGGKCAVTANGGDYYCYECPYPMGGKDCTALRCGIECFRHGATVFFVYHTNSDWTSAYDTCPRNGQTMAMMKDNATHQAVRDYFTKSYADRTGVNEAFWIGLNRTSSSAPFTWVDGTPIGPYLGWTTGRPTKDNCVNIANGGSFNWLWDDDPCSKSSGWSYFPLCQQTYSFLA